MMMGPLSAPPTACVRASSFVVWTSHSHSLSHSLPRPPSLTTLLVRHTLAGWAGQCTVPWCKIDNIEHAAKGVSWSQDCRQCNRDFNEEKGPASHCITGEVVVVVVVVVFPRTALYAPATALYLECMSPFTCVPSSRVCWLVSSYWSPLNVLRNRDGALFTTALIVRMSVCMGVRACVCLLFPAVWTWQAQLPSRHVT
jgi:hypothetical protein